MQPFLSIGILWALAMGSPVNAASSGAGAAIDTLEAAFAQRHWSEAAELGYEIVSRDSGNSAVRVRTAYALFQKGYPNAALFLLKRVPPADWQTLAKKRDRLVEIVALFQKKVPFNILPSRLDQLDVDTASGAIRDEIRFAKGRSAFEKKDWGSAKSQLETVTKSSRYYGPASYLLGTIAVEKGDYVTAATDFSKIFEPQLLSQSAEFWQDMGSDFNAQRANSLNVSIGTDALTKAAKLADLAQMALARVDYAQKNYNDALTKYGRLDKSSSLHSRARLEEVWTHLALGNHDKAQELAAEMEVDDTSFESLEARPVRALILTDAGRTEEARTEIQKFFNVYEQTKNSLNRYRLFPNPANLPAFVKTDLGTDLRLQGIDDYQKSLKKEVEGLRNEDRMLFPVYGAMGVELDPMAAQARELSARLRGEHIVHRLTDLERLYVQCKLILAETYLEDREKLRGEYENVGDNVEKQKEHDRRLVDLLRKAVLEVDEARKNVMGRHIALEFRQSELLWELSSATAILSQGTGKQEDSRAADTYRARSVQIARDIADHYPSFSKHAQSLFFVGFALMEMDRIPEGRAYLEKYVRTYPTHAHVPDAYRILGDLEFDGNHFAPASQYYAHILAFPNSSIVGYALYKIGWCNYNNHNPAKALLALEHAILWAKSLENTSQLLNLKREARRDLVAIFSEVGDHRKALEYFERFIGGDVSGWVAELAKKYDDDGLFEKSTYLYQQLLAMDPPADQKIVYQTRMIHGAYYLRKWDLVTDAIKELIGSYGEMLQLPATEPASSAFQAEKTVNDIALAAHFEFAKTEVPVEIDRVLKIDELYLSAFSKWATSETPLYQYAHYLEKHSRWEPAADAFRDHWTRFEATLKEPLREEALRNLIHSLEQIEDLKKENGTSLSPAATEILKYAAEYALKYGKSKYARAIGFLRTVMFFKYAQVEDGIKETQKVFDADINDDFGKRAFKNLKVAYYERKDWEKTYGWSSGMLARPEVAASPYAGDLKTVREESLFLWADGTKDDVESAKLYLRIAHDPVMERLRDKALHNAFNRYQKADKRVEALEIGAELEKVSPGFEEGPSIAGVRAALYEDAGDYVSALPLFIAFLKKPPTDADPAAAQQARLHAGYISEALQKYADANLLYKMVLANAQSDAPITSEAKRGLERLEKKGHRAPAAQLKAWDSLVALRNGLEKEPLPKGADLAQRIQGGALRLEKVIKQFLEVSGDAKTPPDYAFEAYCTVPFLYGYYQHGIRSLGDGQPKELQDELEKLAGPLDQKASELSQECLSRSEQAFHDGAMYRKVLEQWGWEVDKAKKERAEKVMSLLGGKAPWIDPAVIKLDERQLILQHLRNGATPDSWYSLAKLRFDDNHLGLARLTLLAALAKSPGAPRILNALAVIDQMSGADPVTLSVVYGKAADAGSGLASANLALVHLNGGRLAKAIDALTAANSAGAFSSDAPLQAAVSELLVPPPAPPPGSVAPAAEARIPASQPAAENPPAAAPVTNALPPGQAVPAPEVTQ